MDTNARRRPWASAASLPLAGLVLALTLALPTGFSARGAATADPDRVRLVAAVGERRLLHGRATGGFAFGPEASRKRGELRALDLPFPVLQVAAELRERFDLDPTPAATGNLALAYLVTGDVARGARLAELRALQEETTEALVDLSAAYLQGATEEGAVDHFARAYDAALRALRLDPARREALFNRAMAADGMGLTWIARQAWDDYLKVEPEGPWAGLAREARARAAAREADNDRAARDRPRILAAWDGGDFHTVMEIATGRPDLAREVLRREGIPAVARAKIEGRPLAPALERARELDRIAEEADSDSLDREALAFLERGDLELAAAHIEFARASQQLDDRKVDVGSPGVLHAAAVFRRKGSPYAAQADLQSALVEFFHGRREDLVDRYTALLARHQGRYPLLRARALWMRALCHTLVASDTWQTLLDQKEAFTILRDAGQRDAALQIASQLQLSLAILGRESEAAALLGTMMASMSLEDLPLRSLLLTEAQADHLVDLGLPAAALDIRKQSDINTSRAGPVVRINAEIDLIELAADLGDVTTAVQSARIAARSLAEIKDGQVRSEEEALFALASLSAGLPLSGDPGVGVDQLLAALRARPHKGLLSRALTLLAERRLARGHPEWTEPFLREALEIHLASRSRTEGAFERIKQFEQAERPADDLVALLAMDDRPDDALRVIEQLRNPDAPEPRPTLLPRSLKPGQAAVSYWTLKDRVLATVFTSAGVHHFSLPLGRVQLGKLIRRLKTSVEVENDVLVTRSLGDLYQALVFPLLPALGQVRELRIVADRDLWDVPFAGLRQSPQAAPLVAQYQISFASSLSELSRPADAWRMPRSVLALGSPSWDRRFFGDVDPLPESLSEARGVAALYEHSRVLSGAEATRAALQRLAPNFDVVHVATHAVGNERDPGESFILLSANGSDEGVWRASDPGWDAFSRARLVVLSACRTGSLRSRFGGASLGVLRSIRMVTRAPILVSTGDVDDAASRRLLEAFHRHLLSGQTPEAALRLAQMDAYNSGSGTTWMLYRIVG